MKERVSITLDREILKRIDKLVDGRRYRNRSHFIEVALDEKSAEVSDEK